MNLFIVNRAITLNTDMSLTGLLPAASPVYSTISKVFVPLAVPLLLLDADIRKCYLIAKRLLKVKSSTVG